MESKKETEGSSKEESSKFSSQQLRSGVRFGHRKTYSSVLALKANEALQSLTINKLRYESVGLVGREKESETLRSSLSRITAEKEAKIKKELVFIKGYSGVGKSTLASTLNAHASGIGNGLYVEGKFDFNNREQPYSGIADAFGKICEKIQSQNECNEVKIGETLVAELGSEVHLLATLIPELNMILPDATGQSSNVPAQRFDFEAGKRRWEYAFRVLARVLSSHYSPLVLVLDDLQWADESSLQVLDTMISDALNQNPLMIVGCFRSNEVDDDHILSTVIQDLSQKSVSLNFNVTHIELGSLQSDDANKIVMALLGIDDVSNERTQRLADICLRRTLGNPFFLIEFVTMLEEEGLLSFNIGTMAWIWDEADNIMGMTMSTANVVDILQARMRKLPDSLQKLLQYAACLGAFFDLKCLSLLWIEHGLLEFENLEELKELVEVVEGHFIEGCGDDTYRWVHDKVQEAALSLGDAGKPSFQFELGTVLYRGLTPEDLEDFLFEVTDLINAAEAKRSVEYAELNLRAAQKAYSMAAFKSAAAYVSNGILYLPSDKWDSNPDLTL